MPSANNGPRHWRRIKLANLTKIDLWLPPDVPAGHLFDLKAFQAPQIRLIIVYSRPLAAATSGSLRLALRIAKWLASFPLLAKSFEFHSNQVNRV